MNVNLFSRIVLCGTLLGSAPAVSQVFAVTETAPAQAASQDIKVTGMVKDETGPVIGATIVEKGTSNGTEPTLTVSLRLK
jgi:hypothetical protein